VPADLETIVLKAMAKNPSERYATAQEMASDLRRFLRDEPILARPLTLLKRTRRWARRRRGVMLSAAVAALAALTVLAGSIGWIMRDRAARRAELTADLQSAVEESQRLQKEGKWPQAQAAAGRAEALLHAGAPDPALAERVKGLLSKLAEQQDDVALLESLEAIRLRQADGKDNQFVIKYSRKDYEQAFRTLLHRNTMAPELAARELARRPARVRATLLAALDHWLILANFEKAPEAAWLKQVLSVADSDPWRQGVRSARAKNDREAMEKLARDVDTAQQPPEALSVLARGLQQRGASAAALALLRRAQEACPADFWINHDLGMAFRDCQPPQHEEALRFLTVAAALRPDSHGVRCHLGSALIDAGRRDEAAVAYRHAIRLKADCSIAHFGLGSALGEQGQLEEAIAACRRAIELKPDYARAHHGLGTLLFRRGRLDEAVAALRKAIALEPDHAESHCNLGLALWKQGELAPAVISLERGHELGSRRKDWRYPSAQWVRECRRQLEVAGRPR